MPLTAYPSLNQNIKELKVIFIVKGSLLNNIDALKHYYINQIVKDTPIKEDQIQFIGYPYDSNNKPSKDYKQKLIDLIIKIQDKSSIETLVISDGGLLPTLYGVLNAKGKVINGKPTNLLGTVFRSAREGLEELDMMVVPSYASLGHSELAKDRLTLGMDALVTHLGGEGTQVTKFKVVKVRTVEAVKSVLSKLKSHKMLTFDTETYSLKFHKADIGTIAFGTSITEAIAIDVTHVQGTDSKYSKEVKALLLEFFKGYKGTLVAHNSTYDVPVIVHTLFMKDNSDIDGMLEGLKVFKSTHCTQVMTYLATNNCVLNILRLKENTLSYMGDYAIEVKDIKTVESEDLLQYNGEDCIATYWLYEKQLKVMAKDNQLDLYNSLVQPSLFVYMKMIMTGLPLSQDKINEAELSLQKGIYINLMKLNNTPEVKEAIKLIKGLERDKLIRKNEEAIKAKRILLAGLSDEMDKIVVDSYVTDDQSGDVGKLQGKINIHLKNLDKLKAKEFKEPFAEFNVNSNVHLTKLLYSVMKAPVLDTTATGLPSTDKTVLRRLKDILPPNQVKILDMVSHHIKASKVLGTFIEALKTNQLQKNGSVWVNSSINPTGTISLRPSSSSPNLLNMPSGGELGKLVKSCFVAPEGWVICSADFGALEGRCDAIITKDPAKVKVYAQGYEGHSLNAKAYFSKELPHIIDTPESVNSIAIDHPEVRARAKAPYFAMIYGGTYMALMRSGLSEAEAKSIEAAHKELYRASIEHTEMINQTCIKQGYLDVAFGLRVRTPNLFMAKEGARLTGSQQAESRSINNAKSQSFSLLMNRATLAVDTLIVKAGYEKDILIMNTIYDSVYYLVRKKPELVHWLNINLIREMEWKEIESLHHDDIPMVSSLEIGKSWDKMREIKNNLTLKEVGEEINGL